MLVSGVRIELIGVNDSGLTGAIDVEKDCFNGGGLLPVEIAFAVHHPFQLAQSERIGIQTEDSGKFVDGALD